MSPTPYFSSYDISDDEFQVVEDTVVLHHVYVTKNAVLMTRSFFADAGQSDYPEVTKICVARGFQDVTNYFLRFGPENTTDNRFASFTTSNSDMLEVDDFAGFLTLNAKQYGVATVSVGNIRKDFTISVEICTDDKGHDYNKEVVNPQPTDCLLQHGAASSISACWVSSRAPVWGASIIRSPS